MDAAIVEGVDAAPVLEPAEHVFDLVAAAIKHPVVRDCDGSVGSGWEAAECQGSTNPVRVIAFVAEYRLGWRESIGAARLVQDFYGLILDDEGWGRLTHGAIPSDVCERRIGRYEIM